MVLYAKIAVFIGVKKPSLILINTEALVPSQVPSNNLPLSLIYVTKATPHPTPRRFGITKLTIGSLHFVNTHHARCQKLDTYLSVTADELGTDN